MFSLVKIFRFFRHRGVDQRQTGIRYGTFPPLPEPAQSGFFDTVMQSRCQTNGNGQGHHHTKLAG